MAELAILNPTDEDRLRQIERETGAWLIAYAPSPSPDESAPGFTQRLTPASLAEEALRRVQDLEQRTGYRVVAYAPIAVEA
jgi:hypothetical protein